MGSIDDGSTNDGVDVEMAADNATTTEVPTSSTSNLLPALVQPLLALIQPTPLSFPPPAGLSPHPPITSALSAIHICALECLNNIFLSLAMSPNPTVAADKESGQHVWSQVWSALAVVGTESTPGQEKRKDIWEIAVGVLWGVGNVWKGSLVSCHVYSWVLRFIRWLQVGNEEHVKVLIQFCDATLDPRIKVKCVGTLESLAQHPESVDINWVRPGFPPSLHMSDFLQTISNYLLSILPTPTGPSPAGTEPLIQTISALIDIYSDENMAYDVNFRQGGFIDKLAASVDGVKKAVKTIDRRQEGGRELRRRGEEMRDNLVAFIEYRRGLGF